MAARRGYRRPPDIIAKGQQLRRVVRRATSQAKRDITTGGRTLGRMTGEAARRVKQGASRVRRHLGGG